jgi:serine/threonine protein kinase
VTIVRGQHLIGKNVGGCVLERLLGYGGSSAVFLAQQHNSERQVAIKVFLPRSSMDMKMQKDFYIRFLREAEAASELDHPNILPIYSYGEQDGLPYIIMPYMPGGTLYEYARRRGRLSLEEACWYLEQIASALDYAHDHGCVHCDVKPANILLDSEGHAVLSDFGIAHIMQSEVATGGEGKPVVGQGQGAQTPELLMGTPDYISPEQALGHTLDGRSDIYSLGVMLFFLLAGALPFKADSTIAIALLHVHEPAPSLCMLRADITPALDRVIRKAMAKSPEERFQTVSQFYTAFALAAGLLDPASLPTEALKTLHIEEILAEPEVQPTLLAAQPVVHVRPVRIKRRLLDSLKFTRIFGAIALLLLLTIGAAFGSGAITSRLTRGGPNVQLTRPANIGRALADGLANSSDWPTSSTFFFTGKQYHIENKSTENVALALYADHQYTNFRLSVTMTEIHGSHDSADYYGLVFRSAADQSRYYVFEVLSWGSGNYAFWRFDGKWNLLASGPAPSLITTTGASNTIEVDAVGNTFSFTINHKQVGFPTTDPSKHALTAGEVGLYVEENSEVAFSHLYITPLK